MLEALIIPGSMLGFLFTWMVAEEETTKRVRDFLSRTKPVPAPTPTPVVTPAVTKPRRRWF